jgi:hypothetical protein
MSKTLKMPKHPREMTTREAAEHLFHPEVLQHLQNVKDTKVKPPPKKG